MYLNALLYSIYFAEFVTFVKNHNIEIIINIFKNIAGTDINNYYKGITN
jgi:hypothetical protein